MLIILNFLNASSHDCFSAERSISGWLCVGALRALIDLNGSDQPHWVSHRPRSPISAQPRTSNSWKWDVVVSPALSATSPHQFPGPGPGLQLLDSVPSPWLCLPYSGLVGWCPTARVTIYDGVTPSSPSLGKQTITSSWLHLFPCNILLLKTLKDLGLCISQRV